MLGRFAQRAARQEVFITKRFLGIHEHDVASATGEFPVLKSIVQQQGVAAKLLNGVPAGFHSVLVGQDDHVLEIGGEHIRFVAGIFGVEQQTFSIRHHTGWNDFFLKQEFVFPTLGEWWWFGTVTAR